MSDENLTHTCCWCQSAMDPEYAMCGDCWERELKRRETERDHALDDLKAEIANHRDDLGTLHRYASALERIMRTGRYLEGEGCAELAEQTLNQK